MYSNVGGDSNIDQDYYAYLQTQQQASGPSSPPQQQPTNHNTSYMQAGWQMHPQGMPQMVPVHYQQPMYPHMHQGFSSAGELSPAGVPAGLPAGVPQGTYQYPYHQQYPPQSYYQYPQTGDFEDYGTSQYPMLAGYVSKTKPEPQFIAERGRYSLQHPVAQSITNRRKSSETSLNGKKSKIAGIVYNSTAVYKRLNSNEEYPIRNKTQGKPFSNNLNCRLLLHLSLKTLLSYVDKRNDNEFLVYDWSPENVSSYSINDATERILSIIRSDVDIMSENEKISSTNTDETDITLDTTDIDSLLKYAHSKERLTVSPFKDSVMPYMAGVKYDQQKWTSSDDERLNSHLLALEGVENIQSIVDSYCNSGKVINFHKIVVQSFGCENYVFVKTIRDNLGQILKLDTIKPPMNANGIYEYTPEWIKRFVCYPRYKSGMNLQLLKTDSPLEESFTLYNDYRMLIWDLKEKLATAELSFEAVSTCQIRNHLFNNKVVYVNPKKE